MNAAVPAFSSLKHVPPNHTSTGKRVYFPSELETQQPKQSIHGYILSSKGRSQTYAQRKQTNKRYKDYKNKFSLIHASYFAFSLAK